MRLRVLCIFLALALVAVLCIREPRGEARHPLLIRSAITTSDTAKANMLFSPCPLGPKNIPALKERDA